MTDVAEIDRRGYSVADFEAQYNPRQAVPDHQGKIDARVVASAEARCRIEGIYDLRYGPGPLEVLDIFPAEAEAAPVQLYIHGGYWRAQDKSDVSFFAEPFTAAGATVVVLNYDLCPNVTLPEIMAEIVRAITWTHGKIAEWGGDPNRIFISGNSAGAHLGAMMLAHDWQAEGLPTDVIKGAALLTGVYDPEPVLGISVNEVIGLTPDMLTTVSPMRNLPRRNLPLLLPVGGGETPEWIKQTRAYADLCQANGIGAEYLEVPGADHFDMTAAMGDPDGPVLPAILAQMGL
ncbi:MAG: alpha/beta hydrolase [Alphaproteobacteria bacterium]|nr:alpha/beta hydrolase [Alphaproteobacteria bacterium]